MTKRYRERCESNIYHVTARGVGKQIIFEDDADRRYFGTKMRKSLKECDVELYAWCFMSNHVHLLLRSDLDAIVKLMQKLQTSYAKHFNARHGRTGHFFQNRFDSEPVTSDAQLMAVVRYIHRNPSAIPEQDFRLYEWSSYREYIGRPFLTHTRFVLEVFGGRDEFVAFHESDSNEDCCHCVSRDVSSRRILPDDEAAKNARELLGVRSLSSIATLEMRARNRNLVVLKDAGMPITQISRITGIGRNIIQRAK